MRRITNRPQRIEVWMLVRDRQKIATQMALLGLTSRELAAAAGWSSHTYLLRILNGQARSVKLEPAIRIAERLDVPVEEIFTPRVTRNAGRTDQDAA